MPLTANESHDPRKSIAERYASREDYLQRYERATDELIKQRWILPEDRPQLLQRGAAGVGRGYEVAGKSRKKASGFPRHKAQRHRIHAVAQAGRPRAIVENVAEMRVAQPAHHLAPDLAQRHIHLFVDIFFGDGLPEARPARAGIELRAGVEQRVVAVDAAVQAWRMLLSRRR